MPEEDGGFERVPTGVPGLDELMNGGMPAGNVTLLSGPPGTGKSTFGSQFLIERAKDGSSGIFVSLGDSRERIIKNLREFGWDIDTLLEDDRIAIMSPELYKYDTLLREIKSKTRDLDADFFVLDSVTVLKSYFEDEFTIRRKIMELKKLFEELELTTFLTAESPHTDNRSVIGVEEYVVDGVIELYYEKESDAFHRYIAVKKLRGTEHSMSIHPLTVGTGGIRVET